MSHKIWRPLPRPAEVLALLESLPPEEREAARQRGILWARWWWTSGWAQGWRLFRALCRHPGERIPPTPWRWVDGRLVEAG